jgi:APA family basic amino acid/polyamine antiporter
MKKPAMAVGGPLNGDSNHTLQRSIGVRSLAASIVNVTIGGGIFRLPAVVALGLAAAAPMAYLVCAVAFGLIVLCFAEAGSRVSLTGGPYVYVGTVFGPFAGYLSGVLLYLLSIGAQAAIASAFVGALNALVPGAGDPVPRAIIIVSVFAFFVFVNTRGVKQGARLIEVVTFAKLVPLAVLVLAGAFAINRSNLAWPGMPAIGDLSRMSIVLVFAFSGVESALVPSGEVHDPARTVPRALGLAMISITALYIAIQVVAQGILGPELARSTDAPLAVAAARALGPAGGLLLIIGAVVSMFGYLSGMMFAMPRTLFAFACDGTLPAAIAVVDPVRRVPVNAILLHGVLVTALALSGTFESLAVLSNISALLLYLMCSIAAFELRRRNVRQGGIPFHIPGGAVIPWLSVSVILFLLSAAKADELKAVALALGVGAALYLFRRKPLAA